MGVWKSFGRAQKINLVDQKKGQQKFRKIFEIRRPILEKILDPPLRT